MNIMKILRYTGLVLAGIVLSVSREIPMKKVTEGGMAGETHRRREKK